MCPGKNSESWTWCSFLVLSCTNSPRSCLNVVWQTCAYHLSRHLANKYGNKIWNTEIQFPSKLGYHPGPGQCGCAMLLSIFSLPPFFAPSSWLDFYLVSRLGSNVIFSHDPFLKLEFSFLVKELVHTTIKQVYCNSWAQCKGHCDSFMMMFSEWSVNMQC